MPHHGSECCGIDLAEQACFSRLDGREFGGAHDGRRGQTDTVQVVDHYIARPATLGGASLITTHSIISTHSSPKPDAVLSVEITSAGRDWRV